jgi:hypothetical protein
MTRCLRFTVLSLLFTTLATAQQRTVMVDVFTNSHCGPCATMHQTVDNVIRATPRNNNSIVVLHHVATYSDDPIYQANKTEPTNRGRFFGFVNGTPTTFFNGKRVTVPYSSWANQLDDLLQNTSPISISLQAVRLGQDVQIDATISGLPNDVELSAFAVLVEDVTYTGRNNVSEHRGVHRKSLTPAEGEELQVSESGIAMLRYVVPTFGGWNPEKMRIVVAIQNPTTKEQLQAAQAPFAPTASVSENFECQNGELMNVDVYTLQGQLVYNTTMPCATSLVLPAESPLPSGVYVLRTTTKDGGAHSTKLTSLVR